MRPDSEFGPERGAGLDFGLLGPLEVRVGGTLVPIGSPKLRTLLAALLLNAGRTVPAGTLMQLLWDGRDPVRPRSATQVWISRLRALLAGADAVSIVTTPDGYRLDVPSGAVDLQRFRHWVAVAAGAGNEDDEAAAWERALAEWRDDPLLDIPSEGLQREAVPALAEQRLQAWERRIDLDLRRGRHEQVIEELVGLTARHPLRERLWTHLVTALHRAGRRAEALDAYEVVRRNLRDQLGIDPGAGLRRVHTTVLSGHDSAAPPTPRQLPPGVAAFSGRAAELAGLDRLAASGGRERPPLIVLSGAPGVGKTALAVDWARRVAERFPDGQLWIDLRGYHAGMAVPPEEILGRFLRALGVPGVRIPAGPGERAGLFRSMVDGRRILIGLDNARDPEQVRPLLPGAPGCLVLVTSRDELPGLVAGQGAQPLAVGLPSTADAVTLLARRLGDARVRAERAATMEIVDRCGRLPLALAIIAARAANRPGFPLRAFAAELADAGGRLQALSTGEPEFDVRTAFSWSYRSVPSDQARLFRLLSLYPGPDIGVYTAARVTGLSPSEARQKLDALCRRNLFVEPAPGRYGMHDLMRAYANELAARLDSATDRAAVTRGIRGLKAHRTHDRDAA